MEKRLKISDINVGHRQRKEFGDLRGLAHSIKKIGLLQAIGVTKDGHKLLFGERRLRAVELNGDAEIDCRVLDIKDILEAEHAENDYRLNLTLTEKHALAEALRTEAEGKERRGRPKKGSPNSGQTERDIPKGTETEDHIAVKAGFTGGRSEMRRVSKVIEKGVPELVEAMDAGKIPVSSAALLAEKPKSEQVAYIEANSSNGVIRPQSLQKSHAHRFESRMQDFLAELMGVWEQYGSVEKMFDSIGWITATKAEKKRCIQTAIRAHEELSKMVVQMKKLL